MMRLDLREVAQVIDGFGFAGQAEEGRVLPRLLRVGRRAARRVPLGIQR